MTKRSAWLGLVKPLRKVANTEWLPYPGSKLPRSIPRLRERGVSEPGTLWKGPMACGALPSVNYLF